MTRLMSEPQSALSDLGYSVRRALPLLQILSHRLDLQLSIRVSMLHPIATNSREFMLFLGDRAMWLTDCVKRCGNTLCFVHRPRSYCMIDVSVFGCSALALFPVFNVSCSYEAGGRSDASLAVFRGVVCHFLLAHRGSFPLQYELHAHRRFQNLVRPTRPTLSILRGRKHTRRS